MFCVILNHLSVHKLCMECYKMILDYLFACNFSLCFFSVLRRKQYFYLLNITDALFKQNLKLNFFNQLKLNVYTSLFRYVNVFLRVFIEIIC